MERAGRESAFAFAAGVPGPDSSYHEVPERTAAKDAKKNALSIPEVARSYLASTTGKRWA
jgi:hypothetical protein